MSINSNRMKWWEKYCNKDVKQDVYRDTAYLRDIARAAYLRLLHAKVDEADIDKGIDDIIRKLKANYSQEEIMEYIIQYAPELNKHEEDTDDPR